MQNKANYIQGIDIMYLFRTPRGKSSSQNEVKIRKIMS